MFDIGFSELLLVFVVGLLVLGPKRLPIAIRTVMGWVATIRGLAANVQGELAKELKLQELQESIKKAEALNLSQLSPELQKTVEELKQSAVKMQSDLAAAQNNVESLTNEQVASIQQSIEQESQQLATQTATLQNSAETTPLAEGENETLSADELAELAEMDEAQLAAYYPPDDELATPTEQERKDV